MFSTDDRMNLRPLTTGEHPREWGCLFKGHEVLVRTGYDIAANGYRAHVRVSPPKGTARWLDLTILADSEAAAVRAASAAAERAVTD